MSENNVSAPQPKLPVFKVLNAEGVEALELPLNGAGEVVNPETQERFFYLRSGEHLLLFTNQDLQDVLSIVAGLNKRAKEGA